MNSELTAELAKSQAALHATHTDPDSVGPNTVQVCLSSYLCHCVGRKVYPDVFITSACIAALQASSLFCDSSQPVHLHSDLLTE